MSIYTFFVIFGVFIASVSQLLLKKSSISGQKNIIKEYLNIRVVVAYFLFSTSVVLNVVAMKHGIQLKEIPILENLGYIFVFVLSYFFLKERLDRQELIASIIILTGVIVFYL